jgi:hypothetical protein
MNTYHLKKTSPTQEFLRQADRSALNGLVSKLKDITSGFYDNRDDINGFWLQISEAMKAFGEPFKTICQVSSEHLVSMQVRAEGLALLDQVEAAANEVSALLAISSVEDEIKANLKEALQSGITFPKACFIAEAYNLVSFKMDRIPRFINAIQGFKQSFPKLPIAKMVAPTCLTFPKLRQDFLANPASDTSRAFIELDRTFRYVKYLLASSAVQEFFLAERLGMLRALGLAPVPELERTTARFHDAHSAYLAVLTLTRGVIAKIKVPFLVDSLAGLEFDNAFRKWVFPAALGLDEVSPVELGAMLNTIPAMCDKLPGTVIAVKSARTCPHCYQRTRKLICQKCGQFATCRQCAGKRCPECGFPDA